MNLLDQIAQAREPLIIIDSAGPQLMPSSADRARALAACPLRFVLDRDAMLQCEQLLADRDSMNWSMAAIRMPAPSFWAEWVEPDGNRTGVLVHADELGLCGTIETFWERPGDVPDLAQAVVLFDFRRALAEFDPLTDFAIARNAHPLADHLLFRIDPRWLDHLRRKGEDTARNATAQIVANVLPAADMLFALSMQFSARATLATCEVDRSRLNRQRQRHGRAPLLDHIQVRLNLQGEPTKQQAGFASRSTPARLHQVRGHFVHRGGRSFWRRAHLRGAVANAITSKTVNVTARSSSRELSPFSRG